MLILFLHPNTSCLDILIWEWETIFTCPHTLKFRTRPLADTSSGRGKVCEANLEIKSKGDGALLIFEASA